MNDLYFVEFSKANDWFRVARAEKCCRQNLGAFQQGFHLDFIPLGIFDDLTAAHRFCDLVEILHEKRSQGDEIHDEEEER